MSPILITGATSGIGKSIARQLSENGAKVILAGRNTEKLNSVYNESKNKNNLQKVEFDIGNPQSLQSLPQTLQEMGVQTLSGLVNNAGIYLPGSFKDLSLDDMRKTFEINFFGPYHLTKALLPLLESHQNATVVNISSTLGNRPVANTAAYSASKAALTSLTKTLALELSPKIRFVSVSPGLVDTPIHSFHGQDLGQIGVHEMQPMKRVGRPEEIASLVEYLLDSKAAWITGSDFVIDGGISL